MSRYFDISDLVEFARCNRCVSGIQRVQLRIIQQFSVISREQVFCVFYDKAASRLWACISIDLIQDLDYDADRLLERLGITDHGAPYSFREYREWLAGFPKGSVRRCRKKLELAIRKMVCPGTLRNWMRLPAKAREAGPRSAIDTWPVEGFQSHDELILMGTNWDHPRVGQAATQHFRRGGSVTQVVYDLIPHRFPEFCIQSVVRKYNEYLQKSVEFVSQYICISNATACDLNTYLQAMGHERPIRVWPLPHEFAQGSREGIAAKVDSQRPAGDGYDGRSPFVLCVGTLEIRKNGIALLRAWQRLAAELGSETPGLVFAGKVGWKVEEFFEVLNADGGLKRHVQIVDRPSDSVLMSLYNKCLFTVYPSFAEGWGLPVGEAAWFGRYSIVSSASSLPEVCGSLVDYFDPTDIDELVRLIKQGLNDPDYVRAKEEKIRATRLRTWAEAACHLGELLDAEKHSATANQSSARNAA
jgi:glycosyltransferase involved in cell wall biosynthesis